MKLFSSLVLASLFSFSITLSAQESVQTPEENKQEGKPVPKDETREPEKKEKKIAQIPKKKVVKVQEKAKKVIKKHLVGHLLSIDDNEFVIDLGKTQGIKVGDSVEFLNITKKGFGDETVTVLVPITLGQVLEVTQRHARVRVPLNIDIPIGAAVIKRPRLPYVESKMNRENPNGTELLLTLRPFIPIDTLGFGAIIDVEATHRFDKSPLALSLVLSPMALAVTDEGNADFMTFYGQASYDSKYFEIGLGAGGAKIQKFGIAATQFLRIGTRDGLNIKGTTYIVGIKKFKLRGVKIDAQLPVDRLFPETWLVARMSVHGDNRAGLAYGELGIRTLLKGRGTSGSLYLTPFLGFANISKVVNGTEQECEYLGPHCTVDKNFGGPSAGLTLEWRP